MNLKTIDDSAPDFEDFYNDKAFEILVWMFSEDNHTKRAKLYRTACRVEKRFRVHHGIADYPTTNWDRGGYIQFCSDKLDKL
jgi:hypothetical protein